MLDIFPADEYNLYEAPEFSEVATTPAGPVQIVAADPTRVFLALSPMPGGILIATCGVSETGGAGIVIMDTGGSPLILSYPTHGPAVQGAWFAQPTSTCANAAAITISLRRPPAMYGYGKAFIERSAVAPASAPVRLRGAQIVGRQRRATALPRALRERMPGILGE